MRNRFTIPLAALCATLVGLLPVSAQGQYKLEYKLEKEKPYLYSDTITIAMTQEVMGQEQKTASTVQSLARMVPMEIYNNGASVIITSIDSLRVHVKNAQMDTVLVPSEMLGKRSRLTLSSRGEISNRAVVDSIKSSGLMRAFGQRESIRFMTFPAKEVKVGETWSSPRTDSTDAMGGKMVTVSTFDYTLKGKETRLGKECLKITYSGKLTITGKGSMMGMQVYVEGSGTMTGTSYIDPATCLTVYEESKTDMESTAALTGAQNMTIPTSQTVVDHKAMVSH